LLKKLTSIFNGISSGHKRIVAILGVVAVIAVIAVAAYMARSHKNSTIEATKPADPKTTIAIEGDLLKTGQLQDARKEAQKAKEDLAEIQKREEIARKAQADGFPPPGAPATVPAPAPQAAPGLMPVPPAKTAASKPAKPSPPAPMPSAAAMPMPMPAPGNSGFGVPPAPAKVESMVAQVESEVGGISQVVNTAKSEEKTDKKKDEVRSVYLPVSYMEATLLSGLDAPTSSAGKGNPVPVLIRVKLPAVLPNDVKANLRGCFVVADGKGNLGTERAELVLVTLSCIDRKGQAVIDQSLTGYVVDADGKAGLRGRVVTKMGAIIVRSMMAGMFGGFGQALSDSTQTSIVNPLGTTQTIDPKQIGVAGLGKGITGAFKELEKFYMELAHETLPVIEIGAARPITLVITKGTKIDIMKIKGGNK